MKIVIQKTLITIAVLIVSNLAYAADLDNQVDQSSSIFPGVTYASIATETEKPTSEAPAVISVITAEDLHNHGITSLEQALEEVPGVYSPFRFLNGNFVVRGVSTQYSTNPEVLMLVDGIPIIEPYDGVNQMFITRIPIANIKKIEIIRGPGSAVYGADAFAGVINIITKTDQDYQSSEFRVRAGSYDTYEADGVIKGLFGNINSLFSLQLRTTDGHEPLISADTQSFFDSQFGTSASLAPDDANTYFEEKNASVELFGDNWRSRLQIRTHDLGMGISFNSALTNTGEGYADIYNLDYFNNNSVWFDGWLIRTKIGLLHVDSGQNKPLLPPGAVNGAFPNGVIQETDLDFDHQSLEIKVIRQGGDKHDVVIAIGLYRASVNDLHEKINFNILPGNIVSPIGSLIDLPSDQTLIPNKTRRIDYFSINDDWYIAEDVILSVGGRYDDYSDVSGILNPRIALIWLTAHDLTTKIIANRAFRAPTFIELYSRNNSFQQGNPKLDPSIINTFEIAFEKRLFNHGIVNISISHHDISDIIETIQNANGQLFAINSDSDITGNSLELETLLPISKNANFKSSYSYQRSKRQGKTFYNASPHHKIYAGLDWKFKRGWNLYTNILWVVNFTRDPTDPRDDLGSSSFVGTVLRYTSPTKKWDSYLSIRNIFDEEAVAPSDDFRFLPNDYPLPGINFMAEVRYRM